MTNTVNVYKVLTQIHKKKNPQVGGRERTAKDVDR